MSLGFFGWDFFWYFVISWLPSYLYSVRHIALPKIAIFGALPFLIFGAAEALGGWGAGVMIRRGLPLSAVTKGWIVAGFTAGLVIVPAALVESASASIAFLLGASLSGIAGGNMLAIPKIRAPEDQVALWTGVQNCIGNIGGVLAPAVTGFVVGRTGSYVPAFLTVSVVLAAGIVAYAVIVPELEATAAPRRAAL